jgi:branched-chain amino acid transport system substrate-binding protein
MSWLGAAVVVLLALALAAGGCGAQTKGEDAYVIGAIFDITGPASSLGIPERDSAKLLEEQVNAAGGIHGKPLKILIEDNESDATVAVRVAKKLIDADKVLAIAGPSTSGTSLALVDTVTKSEIALVSAAASRLIVEPVEERHWVFKTAQNDSVVVEKIIAYLKGQGINRVAFLSVNDAFGDSGRVEFETEAAAAGLEVVAMERFNATDKDMSAQLTRVRTANPGAVVVWAIPPAASIITKNFRQLGLEMPLIHSHGIGNRTFIDLAGEAANDVVFPVGKLLVAEQLPDSDPRKELLVDYATSFEEKFKQPRSTFGGHGYDAVALIVEAIKNAGPEADRASIRDELEKISGYHGISGTYHMSAQDHSGLDSSALVMVGIREGKWVIIE